MRRDDGPASNACCLRAVVPALRYLLFLISADRRLSLSLAVVASLERPKLLRRRQAAVLSSLSVHSDSTSTASQITIWTEPPLCLGRMFKGQRTCSYTAIGQCTRPQQCLRSPNAQPVTRRHVRIHSYRRSSGIYGEIRGAATLPAGAPERKRSRAMCPR